MRRLYFAVLFAAFGAISALTPTPANADWPETWARIRKAVQSGQIIQVAKSRAADPACAGALHLLDSIPKLAAAMDSKRNGDTLRILADYQTQLLCLTPASVVMVDFLLAHYASDGVMKLGDKDEDRLLHALFQLGLVTFDQLTDTENSLWWMIVVGREKQFRRALDTYPQDFGVYTFNINSGVLERFENKRAEHAMLDALLHSDELFQKKCYLGDMQDKGGLPPQAQGLQDSAQMACGNRDSSGNTSSKAGAGVGGPVGPMLGCSVDARNEQGLRKQLHCVEKSLAGITPQIGDLLKFPSAKLGGIPDRMCMRGEEDEGGTETDNESRNEKIATGAVWFDRFAKLVKFVSDVKEVLENPAATVTGASVGFDALLGIGIDLMSDDAVAAVREAGPGLLDKTFQLIYAGMQGDGKEVVAGQAKDEWNALPNVEAKKNWLLKYRADQKKKAAANSAGADGAADAPEARKAFNDGMGGACSDRSGAAARAKKAYSCISGETEVLGGGIVTGVPRPKVPTTGLSTDPGVANPFEPLNVGVLACAFQSGDLVRTHAFDTRCATARCIEGEACACDRPSRSPGEAQAAAQAQVMACRQIALCAEGDCPCDPKPFATTGGLKVVTPTTLPNVPGGPIELPGVLPQVPQRKGVPGLPP